MSEQELIKKGDNFALGPYHFVCVGFEHGHIRAMTFIPHRGLFLYCISPFVVLEDPTFRWISRAREVAA